MGEVVIDEGCLPKVVLNVLLVEADDSTRQIISALLRKCSYRVAAVSDGLKAWETLKNKAVDIDLILTEVELPSISGFSLLNLIMEHDICKNIPVIMMSSHDSVSMVFKCMLKGAADFLIKPIRRNELRNLWQHVWRRNAINKLSSPQNLTLPQNKLEAAVGNNAAKTNSTGSVASTQKNDEFSEKTSEAQSTCTSPILEAESAYMENMQDTSKPKSSSNLSNVDTDIEKREESNKFERESVKHNDEAGEKSVISTSEAARCKKILESTCLTLDQGYDCSETENQDKVLRTELSRGNSHINIEIHGRGDESVEPWREAVDLMATFENFPKSTDEEEDCRNTAKVDFDTQLELCSRRDSPGSSCKTATEDRQTLNHSNASAFSRYSSGKLLKSLFPAPSITSANSGESRKLSENTNTSHQYAGENEIRENMTTLVIGQSGQVEPKLQNTQIGFFRDTLDHKSTGHCNVFTPMLRSQSGADRVKPTKPLHQKESSPFPTSTSSRSNSENHVSECHNSLEETTCTNDQNVNDQSKLDCVMHDSPTASQNASTGFNHDATNHNKSGANGSVGSGSDGNDIPAAAVAKNNPESFIDSCHRSYDGSKGTDSHRNSQREAALTKFRLKRKDRCFEKKVRYQSRKRLAEQRPRVKGQFVRQVNNDLPGADAVGGS
ncbi:hypothetical protein RIF29_24014 [Crotalaria pallida]|uniref:Two-component response regulator-like APRR9 n=1 Tax=Crotalaria pallida TaxID=3830 RepID=A0AAN9EJ10_CROPI